MYPRTPRHLPESWRETSDGPSPSIGTEGRDASRGLASVTTAGTYVRGRERRAHIRVSLEFTARLDGGSNNARLGSLPGHPSHSVTFGRGGPISARSSADKQRRADGRAASWPNKAASAESVARVRTTKEFRRRANFRRLVRSMYEPEGGRVDARNAVPDWNELRIPRSSHNPVRRAKRVRGTNVQRTFSRVAFHRASPFSRVKGSGVSDALGTAVNRDF